MATARTRDMSEWWTRGPVAVGIALGPEGSPAIDGKSGSLQSLRY